MKELGRPLSIFATACVSWMLAAEAAELSSPNGAVKFKLEEKPALQFSIEFNGQTVIEPSPFVFSVDGQALTEGPEMVQATERVYQETYAIRGNHSTATNHFKETALVFRARNGGPTFAVEVRAFNDGIAFRCIVETQGEHVPGEATRFHVPEGSTIWHHGFRGHYEDVHRKKQAEDFTGEEWVAPPMTIQLPEKRGYAAITEAALVHYPGMGLRARGEGEFEVALAHEHPVSYPFELRYKEDIERLAQPASIKGRIISPWRVVMVASDLNRLVNSDLISNLSAPPDPSRFPKGLQTEWIKPGRAVWKYLDGGANTFEDMKNFCRWAGELGFEHNILEGFWQRWSDEQLKELTTFAREHKVNIWLWKHTKQIRDKEERRKFFARCVEVGAAGVKLDFFDHEALEVIDFYQTVLKESAEHKLMVNFHGSNKPTGETRQWPHELTREGVRGMESSRLKERAQHNATLPFTRFLAGHADYTPVHFGERRADTTWTHQIGTAVVFNSSLLTFAAHPTNLLSNPGVEVIKSIPATWNETIVLPESAIGEMAGFARRNGKTWFVAVLNGPAEKTCEIPLNFLGSGNYRATILRDDPKNPAALRKEQKGVTRDDVLSAALISGGGMVARFEVE